MTWTRTRTYHALAAVLLALIGTWLVFNTEWVDVDVPPELRGPAKTDPLYAFRRFTGQLGVELTTPDNLDRLPPPRATLLLSSWSWDLFPERSAALRRWVEAGGHLVLPTYSYYGAELAWTTIHTVAPPAIRKPMAARAASAPSDGDDDENDGDSEHADGDRDTDEGRAAAPPSPPRPRANASRRPSIMPPRAKAPACPGVVEPAEVVPAFETRRRYSSCTTSGLSTLRSPSPALWAADNPRGGHAMLRVAVGKGTVTAVNAPLPIFGATLLENDEALLLAATLRLARGQQLWLVADEKRPPLLVTLWHGGAPAILLGAVALTLALWRAGVRFGPRIAPVATARRSVGEQIRGTAAFIAHRGGRALHLAQLRALDTLARNRVPGYDALIVAERAAALAPLVGIDVHTLARAMNPQPSKHLPSTLALLETARRRLLLNPGTASSSKAKPSAPRA